MTVVSKDGPELVENIEDITSHQIFTGVYLPCGGNLMCKLMLSRNFNKNVIGMYLSYRPFVLIL